jgi:hypothetical protein
MPPPEELIYGDALPTATAAAPSTNAKKTSSAVM